MALSIDSIWTALLGVRALLFQAPLEAMPLFSLYTLPLHCSQVVPLHLQ